MVIRIINKKKINLYINILLAVVNGNKAMNYKVNIDYTLLFY